MRTIPPQPLVIRSGGLNAEANVFTVPAMGTYFNMASIQHDAVQACSLDECRVLDISDQRTAMVLLEHAIALESDESVLSKLQHALSDAAGGHLYIDNHLADELRLLRVSRALGFDGLTVCVGDAADGPSGVLLDGAAPVKRLSRADAAVALARRECNVLAAPSPERMAAIVALDDRLFLQWGAGLDQEQTAMLCGTDIEQIEGALDDWEARLGIQVDDVANAFGARAKSALRL